MKENAALLHENLCLHIEMDQLNFEIEKLKMLEICKETNQKLKYINSKSKSMQNLNTKSTKTQHLHTKNFKNQKERTQATETSRASKSQMNSKDKSITSAAHTKQDKKVININKMKDTIDDLNFDMIQISESNSKTCTDIKIEASRTQSAPEIAQNIYFIDS